MLGASLGLAENIDPYDEGSQYAYGENIGWINFDPQVPTDPEHYGVRTSWQAGECFYVGKVDACGHVVTQADHDRWVTLGRPKCWCDPCHCRGDANGDGIVDLGDVVYILNYLYRNGSQPVPDCCI